mgnify:CR=1 FL=1
MLKNDTINFIFYKGLVMNRIWFLAIAIVYIIICNLINYTLGKTYGFPSDQYMIGRIIEALIFILPVYYRYKDAVIQNKYLYMSIGLILMSSMISILIYIPIAAGLIYKSVLIKN